MIVQICKLNLLSIYVLNIMELRNSVSKTIQTLGRKSIRKLFSVDDLDAPHAGINLDKIEICEFKHETFILYCSILFVV